MYLDGSASGSKPHSAYTWWASLVASMNRRIRVRSGCARNVSIIQCARPRPRCAGSTNTSQTQTNVALSVTARVNPTWLPPL
jgi:hypothetical protein